MKTLNENLDHIQVICDNVSQSKSPTKAKYSIKIAGTVQKNSIYVKLTKPLTVIFSCSIKKNVLINNRGYTFQQGSNIQLKLLVEKILSSKKKFSQFEIKIVIHYIGKWDVEKFLNGKIVESVVEVKW